MNINFLHVNTLALFAAMHCLSANAQAPAWSWAIDSDGAQSEELWAICSGTNGDMYATGRFDETCNLGGVELEAPGPYIPFNAYHYLSKINASGEVVWAMAFGEPEVGYRLNARLNVACDSQNNVYITGTVFRNDAVGDFAVNIAGVSFSVPASASLDRFVAKIDPDGNGLWVRNLSTQEHPVLMSSGAVAVDENDNVFFHASIQSDSFEIDGAVYPVMGNVGIILARLNSDGSFVWVQSMGSEESDWAALISPAAGGGLLMSSMWSGSTVHVGGMTVVNPDALIGTAHNRWIAKINAAGEAEWLVQEGGPGGHSTAPVASTPSGGAMVLSFININPVVLDDVTYDQVGYLLTRYSSTGQLEQVTHYPSSSHYGFVNSLRTDGNGQYFFGFNSYLPDFAFGGFQFTNSGGSAETSDFLLASIDENGTPLWAVAIGSDDDENLFDVHFNQSIGPVVCGLFKSSALSFGDITLENNGIFTDDAFMAAMDFTVSVTTAPGVQPLHLYPNPVQAQVAVDLSSLSMQQHTLRIFDARGALQQTRTVHGGRLQNLEVANLPKGSYVLMIQTQGKVYASKFIKL